MGGGESGPQRREDLPAGWRDALRAVAEHVSEEEEVMRNVELILDGIATLP